MIRVLWVEERFSVAHRPQRRPLWSKHQLALRIRYDLVKTCFPALNMCAMQCADSKALAADCTMTHLDMKPIVTIIHAQSQFLQDKRVIADKPVRGFDMSLGISKSEMTSDKRRTSI